MEDGEDFVKKKKKMEKLSAFYFSTCVNYID